ncbi:hypothetical protein BDV59DRAFT_185078 [Aspergillus ambiguus]|uniref:uncharacterized protein n=1 Tax=Aspergillus ambiguus TaxID=176160 RepID=UPI003CCDD2E5
MAPSGSRKSVKLSPSGADDGAGSPSAGIDRSAPAKRAATVNWYPGVWSASRSSKAAPITEVARESISVPKSAPAPDLTSSSTPQLSKQQRSPSLQLTRKAGASSRSLPADATTTKINIASDGTSSSSAVDHQPAPDGSASDTDSKEAPDDSTGHDIEQEQQREGEQVNPTPETADTDTNSLPQVPSTSSTAQPSGWLAWIYPWTASDKVTTTEPPQPPNAEPHGETQHSKEDGPAKEAIEEPVPQTSIESANENTVSEDEPPDQAGQDDSSKKTGIPETSEVSPTSQKRSWLQMWYGAPSGKGVEPPKIGTPTMDKHAPATDATTSSDQRVEEDVSAENRQQSDHQAVDQSTTPTKSTKPSGWSFWFKEPPQDPSKAKAQNAQTVEVSVAGEPSSKKLKEEPVPDTERKVEAGKAMTVKLKSAKSSSALPDKLPPATETANITPETTASKHLQRILPNQVLPLFKDTFALEEKPSFLQSIGRFLHYNKESNNKHVYMIRDPPHIKRALAIGVHGYFPAPLIRSVLGQPTGTSIRFSNMAADAIRKWTEDHGYQCDIEKIALEGEGRIAERVDLLWKLLLNWMEEIRKADFILVACHSQGVPVAIMLVAKLIAFGCLNATRVGVCAMAGVNLGPFHDYRSRWISGSAGELFEFALPYSQVSKDYEAALKTSVDFGVRISYIGSIDDQLVSLESSLFSPVTHPYIYRAVFVDGRVHAPSFLSHLVGFALKLRNLGISDHGLIRELSSPLAGSLYTGDGHSRLYDDEAVYRLAIEFALETSNVPSAPVNIRRALPSPVNPYILPFAMRGLLEEEYVRRELYDETMELLRQFDNWKPTSKVLKDVKFRLEGIRSKL